MQSLKNVQTWAKVFKVLTIIAIVFLSIGIVSSIICFFALSNQELMAEVNKMLIENFKEQEIALVDQQSMLIAFFQMCGGLAIAILTLIYLNKELKDETPFTHSGAKNLFWLGILSLIIPAFVCIVTGIVEMCYGTELNDVATFAPDFGFAICLIVLSQIFKYGADMRDKRIEEGLNLKVNEDIEK